MIGLPLKRGLLLSIVLCNLKLNSLIHFNVYSIGAWFMLLVHLAQLFMVTKQVSVEISRVVGCCQQSFVAP